MRFYEFSQSNLLVLKIYQQSLQQSVSKDTVQRVCNEKANKKRLFKFARLEKAHGYWCLRPESNRYAPSRVSGGF
ncbi:MAG: hypothetical protein RI984_991 [Pseudomonadota bacterium]